MESIQDSIKNCPICQTELANGVDKIDEQNFVICQCERCGRLKIKIGLVYPDPISKKYPNEYLAISSIVRQLFEKTQRITVIATNDDIVSLLHSRVIPVAPYEIALNLLLLLCTNSKLGIEYDLEIEENLIRLMALGYIENVGVLNYYLSFLEGQGFIDYKFIDAEQGKIPSSILITMSGWKSYYDYLKINKESKQVFVAMSFAKEMDEVYENAIRPAILASGFDPYHIGKTEHNNKICDLIITEVRKSRFLIADITFHKRVFILKQDMR